MAVQFRLVERIASAVLGIFLTVSAPAHAQTAGETCAGSAGTADSRIAACTQVIQSQSSTASARAVAYYNRGIEHHGKGQDDLAIADYNQALRINPNNSLAYNNRGIAYHSKGQGDLAIADYSQALRIDPNNALAYYNRGTEYHGKCQDDLAIADYNQALRIDPSNVLAYNNRGIAYHSKGQDDLAMADYNQTLRIDPNYALAYNNRGIVYHSEGQDDLAIADYNQALHIDPNNAHVYYNRGQAFFGVGRFTDSGADFGRALSLGPKAVYALLWLHLARVRSGDGDTAAFAAGAASVDRTKWPAPVVEFYLGNRAAAQTLASAADGGERCEALFYIAEWELWHNHEDAARSGFREAVDSCPRTFEEYVGAKAELARLMR